MGWVRSAFSLCCGSCARRLTALGCLAILTGVVLAVLGTWFIRHQVNTEVHDTIVIDSKKSSGFDDWVNNTQSDSQPIFLSLHFLHLTNQEDVLRGKLPVYVQKGPYVYHEYNVRFDVKWSDNGDLLQSKKQQYFVFDRELTPPELSEDDHVTTINLALLGVHSQVMKMPKPEEEKKLLMKALMLATVGHSPFHTRSVKDLFWGYPDDPVLTFVHKHVNASVSPDFPALLPNMTSRAMADATTAVDVQRTGKHHMSELFETVLYQNMSVLHSCTAPANGVACPLFQRDWSEQNATANGWTVVWGSDFANSLWGTDGTQFPAPVEGSRVPVFVDTLMRSMFLGNTGDETTDDLYGIKTSRFRLMAHELLNATNNPDNAQYYMFGPDGVMNFTTVVPFPMFVTKPHFLDASPLLVESGEGLDPNREEHDTFIDVERRTGIALRASKRIQFNGLLTDWGLGIIDGEFKWELAAKTKEGLFVPYVWVDESQQLTSKQADEFKEMVKYDQVADKVQLWAAVGTGATGALLLASAFSFRLGRRGRAASGEMREALVVESGAN